MGGVDGRPAGRRPLVLAACLLILAGCERAPPATPAPETAPAGESPSLAGETSSNLGGTAPASLETPEPTFTSTLSIYRPILTSLAEWDAAQPYERRKAAEAVAAALTGFTLEGMKSFECGPQSHEIAVFLHARSGLKFSLIPVDEFAMGSPPNEPGREPEEDLHRVTLSAPFLMSCTEVTQSSWEAVMGNNPSQFKGPQFPVDSVTWSEADAYCEQLRFSLPSEAQWEYACRGGSATAYCFGDDPARLEDYAWYRVGDLKELASTQPVARKLPNAFGLYDMHGNVWEWCWDWKADHDMQFLIDPQGPSTPQRYRVARGGSWHYGAAGARSAYRTGHAQRSKANIRGFRPAVNISLD